MLLLSTEAAGVARAMAVEHHYRIDSNRELSAIGAGNVAAGLFSGFVQSGGASQSAAADKAGGQTQLATLAAIVIVAVAGFVRVDELQRLARLRTSAIVLALLCLAGVPVFGVLSGLVITAGLSLVVVIQRLSRPRVTTLAGDGGRVVVQPEGPLFYANANAVRERALAAVRATGARTLVLDLAQSVDLDVETLDMLAGLREEVDLRLASVHPRARARMRPRCRAAGPSSPPSCCSSRAASTSSGALAAVLNDQVVKVGGQGVIVLDFTTWGWVHIVLGAIMLLVSWGLFSLAEWARWTAIAIATLDMMVQMTVITAFPLWALLVITLNVIVIHQLTAHYSTAE